MILRKARKSDIQELMTWFDTAESCRSWGGPRFEFPFTTESFCRDSRWSDLDSFSLVDDSDRLLGFGQFYEKLNRVHLARIAVDPKRRGAGHGTVLMQELFVAGTTLLSHKEFSLYVYSDNAAAIACYRGVGFKEVPAEEENEGLKDCLFMVAKP